MGKDQILTAEGRICSEDLGWAMGLRSLLFEEGPQLLAVVLGVEALKLVELCAPAFDCIGPLTLGASATLGSVLKRWHRSS